MPTKLSEKAVEGSTFGIKVDFTAKADPSDLVGTPFTPNAGLTWSLVDRHGSPVNGKTDVDIASAESIIIALTGDDLALAGGPTHRFVIVKGTYNGVLGNNMKLIDEVSFQIQNLVGEP